MKTILICISFILFANYVQGKEYEDTTKNKFNLFPESVESDFYLYIFTDLTACFICTESISNISRYLHKNYNIKTRVFLRGTKNINLEKFDFPKEWDLTNDYLGVYKDYYDVKITPYYYLLSNSGEVIVEDKAGGRKDISIVSKELEEYIHNNKNNKNENNYTFKINDELILLHHSTTILKSNKSNKTWLFNSKKTNYIVYDSDKGTYEIKQLPALDNTIGNYSFQWIQEDSIISFFNNSYSDYRRLYYFNIITEEFIDNSQFYKATLSDTLNVYSECEYKNYEYVYSLRPINNITVGHDFFVNYYYNTNSKKGFYFNNIDSTFNDYYKIYQLYTKDFITKKFIYSIQNTTDILKQFDKSGKLIKKKRIDLGKNYRVFSSDYYIGKDVTKKMDDYNNRSFISDLEVFDNGVIAITYSIYNYNQDAKDINHDFIKNTYTVYFNKEFEKINEFHYEKGITPYKIESNKILATKVNDQVMYFYEIPLRVLINNKN